MQKTLGVLVSKATMLPFVTWNPPEETGELFGLKLAYYNPNLHHLKSQPQRNLVAKVGFYGVEADDCGPDRIICDVNAESILCLTLLPLSPGEALGLFEKKGWQACENQALWVFHPNHKAMTVAMTA